MFQLFILTSKSTASRNLVFKKVFFSKCFRYIYSMSVKENFKSAIAIMSVFLLVKDPKNQRDQIHFLFRIELYFLY